MTVSKEVRLIEGANPGDLERQINVLFAEDVRWDVRTVRPIGGRWLAFCELEIWEDDDRLRPSYMGCDFTPTKGDEEICGRCGWDRNRHHIEGDDHQTYLPEGSESKQVLT